MFRSQSYQSRMTKKIRWSSQCPEWPVASGPTLGGLLLTDIEYPRLDTGRILIPLAQAILRMAYLPSPIHSPRTIDSGLLSRVPWLDWSTTRAQIYRRYSIPLDYGLCLGVRILPMFGMLQVSSGYTSEMKIRTWGKILTSLVRNGEWRITESIYSTWRFCRDRWNDEVTCSDIDDFGS